VNTLRVKHAVLGLGVIAGVMIGALWAQDSLPRATTHAQLVRVRIGNSCGWCTEGYNDNETVVEPQRIVSINRAYSNTKKYPVQISEDKITKGEWKGLQDLIEARVLGVFAGPRTSGCPGCADEPTAWAELQFSDGSKKSLAFNRGEEPAPIVALNQKIGELGQKAWLRDARRAPH
jgi:hypothetical protein